MDDKIEKLMKAYRYNEGTARAYVESNGRCVYCGVDLLNNLCTYFSADIDHLLPKSKYPEFESWCENWVLSCRACNALKSKMDIDPLPWSAKEAITIHKAELIALIQKIIKGKRINREKELLEIKSIIRGE
jgi:CRISPR/Cas system Type II protein with McrA/HNH and RuvC-like nuclease domain